MQFLGLHKMFNVFRPCCWTTHSLVCCYRSCLVFSCCIFRHWHFTR